MSVTSSDDFKYFPPEFQGESVAVLFLSVVKDVGHVKPVRSVHTSLKDLKGCEAILCLSFCMRSQGINS